MLIVLVSVGMAWVGESFPLKRELKREVRKDKREATERALSLKLKATRRDSEGVDLRTQDNPTCLLCFI